MCKSHFSTSFLNVAKYQVNRSYKRNLLLEKSSKNTYRKTNVILASTGLLKNTRHSVEKSLKFLWKQSVESLWLATLDKQSLQSFNTCNTRKAIIAIIQHLQHSKSNHCNHLYLQHSKGNHCDHWYLQHSKGQSLQSLTLGALVELNHSNYSWLCTWFHVGSEQVYWKTPVIASKKVAERF